MEQPPLTIDKNLREYLVRQLTLLQNSVNNASQLDVLTNIPSKPSVGKIYYFANTTGAITSIGYWGYNSTGWVKLG
jgi:hypothetical protein